ncbi:hypothetical protein C1Y41_18755 [Pantoea sp. ICBG 1758]|uniref:hypothetical protein n=1 Tax=Pantoea sp. ICBG 1758 TaxID=2071682 RepID=UPI000CE33ED4|nr:hypothetical protein [Pantoea sp. ICBG 1758]PPC61271.1 hypothetical protein C1Y41_18755 [Pantoea sp. ICBG 1758]
MLYNDKQINAFAALSASGMVTPAPVVVCEGAQARAEQLAASVRALLLPDVTYPAEVSGYTGKLSGYAASLDAAAGAAAGFVAAVKPFSSPSELLQLKTGWECHVKGNRLSPAPAFALVSAMVDEAVTGAVGDLLQAVSLSALSGAMGEINAKAGAAAAPGATGSAATALAFTEEETAALSEATSALDVLLLPLPASTSALSRLADQVSASTSTAKKAMSDAVAIALTSGLSGDPVMGQAVSAIMPAAVLAALNEE